MLVTPKSKKFGKYNPGDRFSLPDAAANKLILAGLLTKVATASSLEEAVELSPVTGKPKRQYRRRDMVAQS